jgi:hypothetical protein
MSIDLFAAPKAKEVWMIPTKLEEVPQKIVEAIVSWKIKQDPFPEDISKQITDFYAKNRGEKATLQLKVGATLLDLETDVFGWRIHRLVVTASIANQKVKAIFARGIILPD